jgi:hypothetical protein
VNRLRLRSWLRVSAYLCLALVLSTPVLAWVLGRNAQPERVAARGQQLLAARLHALADAREHERATLASRQTNPEWDFMSRTFLVLSLANLALESPAASARYLTSIDRIIDDTLRREREGGLFYFVVAAALLMVHDAVKVAGSARASTPRAARSP